MIFTLEALRAKRGDALLVHCGTARRPDMLVIDGGPSGVYRASLGKRLRELRESRCADDEPLPIRLLMVSHIDDDHIKGILDLTKELRARKQDRKPLPYAIRSLWHNSFDDVVGNHVEAFVQGASKQVGVADFSAGLPRNLPVNPYASMVLSSVPQGRTLRDDARLLQLSVNDPFGGLVVAPGDGSAVDPPLVEGLDTLVVGPDRRRVEEFQTEWDEELTKRGIAAPEEGGVDVAAYLDGSVYNLASIVVLLRAGGETMLLTGDARGDDILAGLRDAGLLDANGKLHVSLLKVPHHGSDRNVEPEFFRDVTADHYVISGDGSHGNPEADTVDWLLQAQRGSADPFTIWLTYPPEEFREHHGEAYPVEELRNVLRREKNAGTRFEVKTPGQDELSVKVDLLDPLPD